MIFDFETLKAHTKTLWDCILCLQAIHILRTWIPCNNCGYSMQSKPIISKKLGEYCFSCDNCSNEKGIRTNSMLSNGNIPFFRFIGMLWCFVEEFEIIKTERFVGIRRETVGKWFTIFRKCLSSAMCHWMQQTKLGIHNVVEIDESDFSKKPKHQRGNRQPKHWVFGMVERNSGKCILKAVPNRRRETLLPIILEHINAGARINSDQFSPYFVLGEQGFEHAMVNHSMNFVDPGTMTHTNSIEGTWAHAKKGIKKSHGLKGGVERLQQHLDDFMFRKTFCKDGKIAFTKIGKAISFYYHQYV